MYDRSDPRAVLQKRSDAAPTRVSTEFFSAQYGRFYEEEPQISDSGGKTWIVRGQNFVVLYTEGKEGGIFGREGQPDEYALIVPDPETRLAITTDAGTQEVPGYSVAFLPPGKSSIRLLSEGRIIRFFTPKADDLAALSSNASEFAAPHPTVPPFKPWPDPPDGFKLRWYSLDVPTEPGRFGRIFRCTTFMINYLNPRIGPRDRTKVSPHSHDDFEQCSLALEGTFIHHLRWPWTTNMNVWREDEHSRCPAPSVCVIPPPAIHTSTSEEPGVNQLVDVFSPPRRDFSAQDGWVLNADEYPAPSDG